MKPGPIAQEQQRGGFGDAQQLLGIDGDRVGLIEAIHQLCKRLRQRKHPTDGSIHMHPDPLPSADGGDGRQGVNRTAHGGAGGGHHSQAWTSRGPQGLQRLFQCIGAERTIGSNRNGLQRIVGQAHHQGRFLQGDVGVLAAENHTIAGTGVNASSHQGHQVAQGATAGQHTTSTIGETQPLAEPAAELLLEVGQAGGKLLRQQIVVQAGTDQIRRNGGGEGWGVQMGQRPGVGRLIGPIHHQLKILQQLVHSKALNRRCHGGLGANGGQRKPLGRGADPVAQQITGLMQEGTQRGVVLVRRGERIQRKQPGPVIRFGVHRERWSFDDPRLSWDGAQRRCLD